MQEYLEINIQTDNKPINNTIQPTPSALKRIQFKHSAKSINQIKPYKSINIYDDKYHWIRHGMYFHSIPVRDMHSHNTLLPIYA